MARPAADKTMPEITFAKLLEKRNPTLHSRLEEIRRRACEDWIHLLKPDAGSHAGYIHLSNVERNADKMIPDASKEEFSDGEVFLLLASILLHDLGRIVPDKITRMCPVSDDRDKPAPKCGRVKRKGPEPCPLLKRGICKDRGRFKKSQGTHACLSKHLIEELWPIFGLPDEQFAHYCGLIACWHQLDKPPEPVAELPAGCPIQKTKPGFSETSLEPYGRLRVPLLAAILRIADETENYWTRAIRQHWYDEYILSDRSAHQLGKAFRRGIHDIEFCPEGKCVIMHVPEELEKDPEFVEHIVDTGEKSQSALTAWGEHLKVAHVEYERVFIETAGRRLHNPEKYNEQVSLQEVLEDLEDKATMPEFLKPGKTELFFAEITELVRGTLAHKKFRWSAIGGAIKEPLEPKTKWVIKRMGQLDDVLRIISDDAKDLVEITVNRDNWRPDYLGKILKDPRKVIYAKSER